MVDIGLCLAAGAPRLLPIGRQQGEPIAQPPRGPSRHGAKHVQIAEEGGGGRRRSGQIRRGALGFLVQAEDEAGIREHELADRGGAGDVRLVEAADLSRAEGPGRDRVGQAEAGGPIGARQGHEVLHGRVRDDSALLHASLDDVRKIAYEAEPPRDPADAPIEPSRELLHGHAVVLVQRPEQPPFFDGAVGRLRVEPLPEDQGVGFRHLPGHGLHGVPVQPLQAVDALIPIDHDLRAAAGGDHHDRHLLADVGERGEQPPFTSRLAHPQVLVAQIELVKFEVHAGLVRRHGQACHVLGLVLRGYQGKSASRAFEINDLRAPLVLRGKSEKSAAFLNHLNDLRLALVLPGRQEHSAQVAQEIRADDAERVLGQVPREAGERGGKDEWIDGASRIGGQAAALQAMGREVVRIPSAPRGLRAHPPSGLAARCRARSLPKPNVTIRDKPPMADAAGTLPEHPQMLDRPSPELVVCFSQSEAGHSWRAVKPTTAAPPAGW
jgi:hypothetical protein